MVRSPICTGWFNAEFLAVLAAAACRSPEEWMTGVFRPGTKVPGKKINAAPPCQPGNAVYLSGTFPLHSSLLKGMLWSASNLATTYVPLGA